MIALRNQGKKLKQFGYYSPSIENKISPLRDTIISDLEASIKEGKFDITGDAPLLRTDIINSKMSAYKEKVRKSHSGEIRTSPKISDSED